ncbi:MAG: hypothetical protein KC492_37700, partial [Myxococcales bacterium]|nr:hypothetical protein [Myxococcales bacterium]
VWERGWAREVEGAQAAPDLGVPCAVEVDVRDDGDWLILRAPTFGLAVKPHPLAWEADPIGLQQELVGLVLSELG